MIVAQEKTGYYKLSEDAPPKKKSKVKAAPKRPRLAIIGLVLAGLLTGVMITVYCSQVITLGYQITRLEKELALLRVENHNLAEEVQKMTSLERIENIAVGKLGMVKPDNKNVLVVTVDGINQQKGTNETDASSGQDAGNNYAGQEKTTPLVRAFTELVDRFGDKILTGHELGAGPSEGKDAENYFIGAQKNNPGSFSGNAGFFGPDFTTGMAAAC
jgi:cell division protein FtsL